MSISHILASLTIRAKDEDIPQSSYAFARKMLLDTIGCAFAGMKAPGIAELVSLERELSAPGNGTVFSSGERLALPSAAYCNAAMIHALDFDNNYPRADIHILSIVFPIALACSEERGRNGRELLSAMILGVEAAARIAKPYIRARRQHSYFLTTSLVGGWGGVATAARLLGLSIEETVNAFGIYYAHTCGNRETLLEKKLTKRMQPAIAVKAALYSALLAAKGFTGPEDTFEGKAGFYRLYTLDNPPAEEAFRAIPEPYGIEELVVKQYPTCGFHHANIDSALHLKQKHGFRYEDIERVEFFLREGGKTLVSMPFTLGKTPQIDAQFSAPYAIALALNKGEVHVRSFLNEAILGDPDTIDLATRTVEVTRFAEIGSKAYQKAGNKCNYTKVYLRNGDILEHGSRGGEHSDPNAMDLPSVERKFRQCLSIHPNASKGLADRIVDAVKGFEEIEDVRGFLLELIEQDREC